MLVAGEEISVTGDLIENHRIFLNMEVTFCMNPFEDFRLTGLMDTRVGFLSMACPSSSLLLEHLMV